MPVIVRTINAASDRDIENLQIDFLIASIIVYEIYVVNKKF